MKVSIALAVAGAETPRASVEKINGVVRPRAEHYYMTLVKEIAVILGDIAFLDINAEWSWVEQEGGAVRDTVIPGRRGRAC
jgi:hypothetical protein